MVAGALAAQALNTLGITVTAYTSQVADIKVEEPYNKLDLSIVDNNMVRCPDAAKAVAMIDAIAQARKQGDTLGGIDHCNGLGSIGADITRSRSMAEICLSSISSFVLRVFT